MLKYFDRRSQCAVQKQLAAPVEQVALARVRVRGGFVFICRLNEVPVFFLYLTQQVMQLGGVFEFQKLLNQLPRIRQPPGKNVCQRQIVAIVVGRGIDPLGLFESMGRPSPAGPT